MSLHFDGCPGACPCSSTPTASYPEVPLLPLRLAAKRHTTASMVACEALEPAWITARQIEAVRRAITRYARRGGKIWEHILTGGHGLLVDGHKQVIEALAEGLNQSCRYCRYLA
ncbi:hypothetical protein VPH35_046843 [Triticum aestivum]